jgi:two-component sensor histidine kinase
MQNELGKQIFKERYLPDPKLLKDIRYKLNIILKTRSIFFTDSKLADLQLIITEATSNAIRHGCSSPADRVEIEIYLQPNRKLDIRVSDPGHGFVKQPGQRFNGLAIIENLTEEVKHYRIAGRFYCRMIFDLGEVAQ